MKAKKYRDTLKKVIRLIRSFDAKYLYLVGFFILFSSLIPAISLKIMQKIINLIQTQIGNLRNILFFVVIYLLIDFIQIVLQAIVGYYKNRFTLNFNMDIKEKLLVKASKLRLSDFEDSEVYNMLMRAENQVDGGILGYFDTVISAIGTTITAISFVIIVFSFKLWIMPILLFIPFVRFVVSNKINKEEFNIITNRTNDERKAWYDSYIITCGMNYKELRLYNLFDYFIGQYDKLKKKFIIQDLSISKKRLKYIAILNLIEQLFIGGLFVYTIYCGYVGVILIGDVILYTRAIISSKNQIQGVVGIIASLNKSNMFINQFFDFFNLEDEHRNHGVKIRELKKIVIRNVSYKYHSSDSYALKNINLEIKQGDFIAIIGRNGSGKSTLMKILLGYYDDYEGEIFVNGINLRDVNHRSYLDCIGALFQDFTKYESTIRENICYSNLKKIDDDETIMKVCKQFGLQDMIERESETIDTQLGFWFEDGKQISIGQWQKVALSRVFVREAGLYLLDEPNAALDPISEYQMAQMYKDIFKDKMGIVIVHKFNHYVDKANKIVVLKDGIINAIGTHAELENKSEEYGELYRMNMDRDM